MTTRKLFSTIKICATLFMARMFGRCVHTVGDFNITYAKWRGEFWSFPTEPMNDLDDQGFSVLEVE